MLTSVAYYTTSLLFIAAAAILFLAQQTPKSYSLLAAMIITACWACACGLYANHLIADYYLIDILEIIRNATWLTFLATSIYQKKSSAIIFCAAITTIAVAIGLVGEDSHQWSHKFNAEFETVVHLIIAAAVIYLLEALHRNTEKIYRWRVNYWCLALGTFFVFDFYIYSKALIMSEMGFYDWEARGFVTAVAAPLVVIAALKNPQSNFKIAVSQNLIFNSAFVFIATGYFIVAWLAFNYIDNANSATKPLVLRLFVVATIMTFLGLFFSRRIRIKLKNFIVTNFFQYRYDYRKEWLTFTQALSANREQKVDNRIITAVAALIESDGGSLWLKQQDKFLLKAYVNTTPHHTKDSVAANESLFNLMQQKNLIINVNNANAELDFSLPLLPPQLSDNWIWLLIPLLHRQQLVGFLCIKKAASMIKINWEVQELLQNAAQQAASLLVEDQNFTQLLQAQQFEQFNLVSAYIMHDLKNVVSKLSLITENADKFQHNPEFVADSFATVKNSVTKMQKLMQDLKNPAVTAKKQVFNVVEICYQVIDELRFLRPTPVVETTTEAIVIKADKKQFARFLFNLVKNAVEATAITGVVTVKLAAANNNLLLQVADNGCGMEQDFIDTQLFKPFSSSKGKHGYGVGAFEIKQFVDSNNGTLKVESKKHQGTIFTIEMPVISVIAKTVASDVLNGD